MTSPLTEYILRCLKGVTRAEAGKEARRLKIRLDWAEFYFNTIGRMG